MHMPGMEASEAGDDKILISIHAKVEKEKFKAVVKALVEGSDEEEEGGKPKQPR
jgi:hypothetical protein